MKILIIAFVILSVVITGAFLNSVYIGHVCNELISAISMPVSTDGAEKFNTLWEKHLMFFAASIRYDTLAAVSEELAVLNVLSPDEAVSISVSAAKLRDAVAHIRDSEGFSFSNII